MQAYSIVQAEQFLDDSFDLAVLDINLPDGSGLDLCRRIKEKSSTSVIFLTANDMEIDVVAGLESGASDYITKPFSLAILRARVAAVLRNREDRKQEESKQEDSAQRYADGKFVFDFEQMTFSVDGEKTELSKTEQKLLRLLVCNAGQTLRRECCLRGFGRTKRSSWSRMLYRLRCGGCARNCRAFRYARCTESAMYGKKRRRANDSLDFDRSNNGSRFGCLIVYLA